MHAKLRMGNTSRHGTQPGFEATHPVTHQQPGAAGVEGAGGTCRGAGGRQRGLAGLRGDAPSHTSATQRRRCGGRRRAWLRCPWAAARPGRASRRRAERSSQRGRLAGGPPPTGTHSGRGLRRPEHQRRHMQQPGKTKTADPEGSAVSSCARGELNPHSITGTRT